MQRLQTRAQFQAVLAGRTIARTRHFALHCVVLPAVEASQPSEADSNSVKVNAARLNTGPGKPLFAGHHDWLGAMTPKRSAKRAVTRNVIKRQIYQVSSDLTFQPPLAAYVVRLAAGFDKAVFPSATSPALKAAVRQELVLLFAKAGLSLSTTSAISADCAALPTLLGATP